MSAPRTIPLYVFHPDLPGGAMGSGAPEGEEFYLPLALGLVVEAARAKSPLFAERYAQPDAAYFTKEQLLDAVSRHGPGVCLFSSYLWNAEPNLEASRAVKALEPRCVTVHGGPSTPKHPEATEAFLRGQQHVDLAVRGEGELCGTELLECLAGVFEAGAKERAAALSEVSALTFLGPDGTVVRTPDRPRIDDLAALPSPYTSGYFDRMLEERAASGRSTRLFMATLETNRGCPYRCVFCDWGSLTLQKVRTFPLERIRADLEWIGRHEVRSIFLGDSNFGILERDLEVAEVIADARRRYGFPRNAIANYAKNGSKWLEQAYDLWHEAGVGFEATLSLQTTDDETLSTIRRSNISTQKYVDLGNVYRRLGLDPGVQLMMGLPGSTVASWKNDLQFAFDRREHVQIFPTRMLPNSPMAEPEYVALHRLRTDEDDTLIESDTFTEDEWRVMGRIACGFLLYSNWGILRYFLMYLQWDHGVRALDFIERHVEAIFRAPEANPVAAELLKDLLETPPARLASTQPHTFARFYEEGWASLFEEIAGFAEREIGIARDEAFSVALEAQRAIMPKRGFKGPVTLELTHDFAAYVAAGRKAMLEGERPEAPLSSFGPGTLRILDAQGHNGAFDADDLVEVAGRSPAWELASSLSTPTP